MSAKKATKTANAGRSAKAPEAPQGETKKQGLTKVLFQLEVVDGYPPVAVESVWAKELADGTCQLKNIPFFAALVSFDDVVSVKRKGQERFFKKLVRGSGHSTLRVILQKATSAKALGAALTKLGCSWEGNTPKHLAIDVPPEAPLEPVQVLLAAGERAGKWEYEESALQHAEQ